MKKKVKKVLKKTMIFAVTVCAMLTGAVFCGILPIRKMKEKLKAKKTAN